jgi:hypothetical protein
MSKIKPLIQGEEYTLEELIHGTCKDNATATRILFASFIESEVGKHLEKQDICQMFFMINEKEITPEEIIALYAACSGSGMKFMILIGALIIGKVNIDALRIGFEQPELLKAIIDMIKGEVAEGVFKEVKNVH